jgi:hypothetical protein
MYRRLLRLAVAVLLAVSLFSACGSDPASLSPVRGTIYHRGAALRGGTVVFTPDLARGGNGPLARAEIQTDGSYVLRTDDQPGAVPGWHRVTVMAVQAEGAGQRALVPRRYSDPEISGLSYQVKPGQANTIDIHLE